MCDIHDVLEASHNAADVIVTTVYDYGENSFGQGIRRLANEVHNLGFQSGYEQGYETGSRDGFVKGTIVNMAEVSLLGLIIWGATKISKKQKEDKLENKKTVNSETTEGKNE